MSFRICLPAVLLRFEATQTAARPARQQGQKTAQRVAPSNRLLMFTPLHLGGFVIVLVACVVWVVNRARASFALVTRPRSRFGEVLSAWAFEDGSARLDA
jgi:hypothetical protein